MIKRMLQLSLVLLGVSVFLFGLNVRFDPATAAASAQDRYNELQLFARVLNMIERYYVEPVDAKKIIQGGIKGMLKELDPHTNFLPPEIFKEFESETSGEFGGIGIEITLEKGILTVISPIEDTPAWKAGILSGDKIVSINGKSTKGMSLVDAAKEMRGSIGGKVELGIFRNGFDAPKNFAITRATVKLRSVKYTDLQEGYGYFRITSFVEKTADELAAQLKIHEKNSSAVKGIILDLRGNPGGLLDQAVKVSDLFLESGVIVSTIGRDPKEKEVISAKKGNDRLNTPIIVLVNEYSASASEILAGALQDNQRALIMGKRSFGKGSVQSVVKLGDGSGLKLTVARYFTPKGRSIQAEGIVPDVEVEAMDPEIYANAVIKKDVKREADIAGHLLGEKEKQQLEKSSNSPFMSNFWFTNGEDKKPSTPAETLLKSDFQALTAFNYLKSWQVMSDFAARQKSHLVKQAELEKQGNAKTKQ